MDQKDYAILSALEKDARVSLKQLATTLHMKVNSIYYRLNKLQNNRILQDFTISINPLAMGMSIQAVLSIHLHPLQIDSLNTTFLEHFAQSLAEEYEEFSFVSISNTQAIIVVGTFYDKAHLDYVLSRVRKSPYVKEIKTTPLSRIVKGTKVFNLLLNYLATEKSESSDLIEEEVVDATSISNPC
ncbi:MAG TPA: Lrp/AsnC family transcriptional regulator [Candidatus Lokiarchaeia archaeon]|nr:Lrp/AsnC family transcriptional regulator [Candidatus Lokiarchaeia archaeon]